MYQTLSEYEKKIMYESKKKFDNMFDTTTNEN